MEADPNEPDLDRRLLAYVLITVGGLVTLLSGACTLTWLGLLAVSAAKSPAPAAASVGPALFLTLLFGVVSIAAGIAMIGVGRSLLKKPTRRPQPF